MSMGNPLNVNEDRGKHIRTSDRVLIVLERAHREIMGIETRILEERERMRRIEEEIVPNYQTKRRRNSLEKLEIKEEFMAKLSSIRKSQ